MSRLYIFAADPQGFQIGVCADDEKVAHVAAWLLMTDEQRDGTASIELVGESPFFKVGDTVRHVSTDRKGFQTIYEGRVREVYDVGGGEWWAIVPVHKTRVEHPINPGGGRDIPSPRDVLAWPFSELTMADKP